MIAVDNGTSGTALESLRELTRGPKFTLIENGENVGIALALNQGVLECRRLGCQWVALFDQDSEVTDGFVEKMIEDFHQFRKSKDILQIVPRYLDPATGKEEPVSRYDDGGLFLTITSGSVFPISAFDQLGLFRKELFIYCVDDDFSLRIRAAGKYIGLSPNAVLLHQSGNPTYRRFMGRLIATKNYRPESRYYYGRNKVWLLRTYWRHFPRLIVPTLRQLFTIPFKIALMEEKPWPKVSMFYRGVLHGLAGRMGKLRKRGELAVAEERAS